MQGDSEMQVDDRGGGSDKHNVDPTACLMRSREEQLQTHRKENILTSNVVIMSGKPRFQLPGQEVFNLKLYSI